MQALAIRGILIHLPSQVASSLAYQIHHLSKPSLKPLPDIASLPVTPVEEKLAEYNDPLFYIYTRYVFTKAVKYILKTKDVVHFETNRPFKSFLVYNQHLNRYPLKSGSK